MTTRTFQLEIDDPDADSWIERAKKAADENNAVFTGDSRTGSFQGRGIAGTYTLKDDLLCITITRKPILVPWEMVESVIKGFFDGSRS